MKDGCLDGGEPTSKCQILPTSAEARRGYDATGEGAALPACWHQLTHFGGLHAEPCAGPVPQALEGDLRCCLRAANNEGSGHQPRSAGLSARSEPGGLRPADRCGGHPRGDSARLSTFVGSLPPVPAVPLGSDCEGDVSPSEHWDAPGSEPRGASLHRLPGSLCSLPNLFESEHRGLPTDQASSRLPPVVSELRINSSAGAATLSSRAPLGMPWSHA